MNSRNRSMYTVIPVLMALLGACDETDELADIDDTMLREGDLQCPRWQCGYNTSEINGKSLTELNLDGEVNGAGIKLLGFTAPLGLGSCELDVDGDELIAHCGLLGNTTLRGVQLTGSVMQLEVDNLEIAVTIAAYEEVDSWAEGVAPLAAYALVYPDLGQSLQRSICKGTLVDPLQASVVVLAGERYDNIDKTVIPNQHRWLTLACAGSAAAKMALLGYGPHAELDNQGTPASVDQRQATLKMLTADYCGTGHSYTVDGTPLAWENRSGTVSPLNAIGEAEAIWTSSGALCLDTPRIVDREHVACNLPTCAGLDVQSGEWMTHVAAN